MVKIKNIELNSVLEGLVEMAKAKTKGHTALKISKNVRKILEAIKDLEESKKSILKSRCVLGDNGEPKIEDGKISFLSENDEIEAQKEYDNVLNTYVDVSCETFEVSEIEYINDISGEVLFKIDVLIKK